MNIAIIFTRDDIRFGASNVALRLLPELVKGGCSITAIFPTRYGDGSLSNAIKSLCINTHYIDIREWCYTISSQKWKNLLKRISSPYIYFHNMIREIIIAKWLAEDNIDVILVFDCTMGSGYIASKILKIPSVGYLQSVPWLGLNRRFYSLFVTKLLCRIVRKYIAISKYVAKEWNKYTDGINVDIVYNGIIENQIFNGKRDRSNSHCCKMVVVGNISKTKGQKLVVDAVSLLKLKGVSGFSVSFIGLGENQTEYQKSLMTDVTNKDLRSIVKFRQYTNDISSVWESSDIVISACEAEGFGLSIIEGMASGLLAIGPDTGGVREILDEGYGLLYRHGDARDLARKMEEGIEIVRRHGSIIDIGRQHALEFSFERQSAEIISILKSTR